MGVDCLLQNKVMVGNKEEKKSSMYESRRKKKRSRSSWQACAKLDDLTLECRDDARGGGGYMWKVTQRAQRLLRRVGISSAQNPSDHQGVNSGGSCWLVVLSFFLLT